ncbi:MAG: AsmA-like C-terminal domain-containing protein, partial [Alphaproteobacteria bacterium]|nr:AsmA-like C-terminal domain-containing protein [Alphaproteobacteria bacterium]
LHLTLNKQGELNQTNEEEDSSITLETLMQFLKKEKHLIEFSLINAEIKITDTLHNAVWHIPQANLTYSRRFYKNKLEGLVRVALDDKNDQTFRLKGSWKKKDKTIPLIFKTDQLDLTRLIPAQKYPYLKNFTTPVSLTVKTQLDPSPLMQTSTLPYWRKAVDKVNFEIIGGHGIINLPDPVIARYDLENFKIDGIMYGSADNFDITNFHLVLQNKGEAQGSMTVSGLGELFDTGNWKNVQAELKAKTLNIPMNMLPSYWPASLGPDVHAWVKRNLRGGMIDDSTFTLHFKGLENEPGIDADMVDGIINVTGTQVVYLDDMPPIDDVSGQVHLTLNDLIVTVKRASSHNITAQAGGTFSILDMQQPITTAALDMNLNGRVPDILEVLDYPALELTRDIGLNPDKTTGIARGNLQLYFPMGDAFQSSDQIYVKVDANVRNADIDDIALGLGLQDAILKVKIEGRDLDLNGTALFYGATAKYTLAHTFDHSKKTQTNIQLHVNLNNKAREYLNYPFFTAPAVSGVMPTELSLILKNDKTGTLNITTDLTNAEIDLREIGWLKPAKIPGSGAFKLELADGLPTVAPTLSVSDEQNCEISGHIDFDAGKIKDLNIESIKAERTKANIKVAFEKNSDISIEFGGSDLDISRLIKQGTSLNIRPKEETAAETPVTIRISAFIDKLWLSEQGYSENNSFSAFYQNEWKNIKADGYVGEKKVPQHLTLSPADKEGLYVISMTSEDAGYILKALDYISTVKGGQLKLNGFYTPGIGTKGALNISDFYIENDQMLIKILQMTSLTGILDTLRGEGLFFDEGEIPFTTDNESLTIESALVSGSSLGITLNGKYYRETGYMNLYGSIVPFYSVNSLLGKIPLIGGLFSGEKGGGLIAPTYTIKGKLPSPDVSVNAFSALAPGAIRSMFGMMTRDEGDLSKEDGKAVEEAPKKEEFKPLDPSLQTEIKDEELQHE